MKRYVLFLLFGLLIGVVQAQKNDFKPEMYIGASGGINLSKVSFIPTIKTNFLMGGRGGITFRYIEERNFGLQAELNLSCLGWDEFFENTPYQFSRTFYYIEIPFLAHIYFGNKRVRGMVNLGPQFGFMAKDSYQSNFDIHNPPANSGSISSTIEQYTEAIGNRIDYGICGGAGMEIHFGKNAIGIEGRYYFGLGDVFNNRKKDTFSTSSNQNISVSISYLFQLK